MTVTLSFQSSGTNPGNARPMMIPPGGGLSIGRGPTNDVVLPDPDKLLSKSHCVIEDHNGNVVVVDLSTNGTFLNYGKTPLGRTPTPLNNGDILSLGSYELLVEISQDLPPPIADPLGDTPVSHGSAVDAPDPMALLDDAGPEGDFLDDLLGAPEGPKGPGQIKTADPIDDLLPPLGEEEDPFFADANKIPDDPGPSVGNHGSAGSDSFRVSHSTGPAIIPDDWEDDLLAPVPKVEEAAPTPTPTAPPPPSEKAAPEPDPAPEADPEPTPDTPQTVPPALETRKIVSGDQAAARAFLQALNAENLDIPDEDLHTTMAQMGRVMRTMITGLREILMTRTSIKSEFRIEQTMISAGGNNPLKFSISPEQAIEALVRSRTRGYLGAETATEQALTDIKAHEVAMVTGMEAALKGILARLDPEVLGQQIESGGGMSGLLKGKKARYWEVYEKMYGQIADQAENDFHELFSREFARAYKDQLEKLK